MARPRNGAVPSLRPHKTGQARVTLNGRDFYLGTYGTPEAQAEYHALISRWLAGGRKSLDSLPPVAAPKATVDPGFLLEPAAPDLSLVELLARHIADLEATTGRPASEKDSPAHRTLGVARKLMKTFGREEARSFGPLKLKMFRETLVASGLVRDGVNQAVSRIKAAFRWAASEELVPIEVYQKLAAVEKLKLGRTPARESKRVLPVPDDVVEATIAKLGPVVGDLVRILALTGARPSEIASMRPVDVDRSGAVWLYRPVRHKCSHRGKQRTIPLGPRCQAILTPYLVDREPERPIFRPEEGEAIARQLKSRARKTPLSCGNKAGSKPRRGRRFREIYNKDSIARAVTRAAEKAEVPHWHVYQLRHSAATKIREQHGLDATAAVLGHASLKMAEHYAQLGTARASQVALDMG